MKQKQHYLPKFIINNFKNEKLLYFDGIAVKHKNPKNIFMENNFYGDFNSKIELKFAEHENKFHPLIRKILISKDNVMFTRKERNDLSLLLGFLPLRNKSMKDNFKDKDSFLKILEYELYNIDFNWKPPLKPSPINKLLEYTMTIWESDIDFPLFPENMGMNETNKGNKINSKEITHNDCLNTDPDTLFFPLSKNKIIIFYNQKFRIDNVYKKSIEIYGDKGDYEKNFTKSLNLFNDYFCERSIMVRFLINDFWNGTAFLLNANKNFNQNKNINYNYAKEDDIYKYHIRKVDNKIYKYILLENILWYGIKKNYLEIILPNDENFLIILKELFSDVVENEKFNSDKLWNGNDKKTHDMKNWYIYAVYKISNKQTISFIKNLIDKIENAL